MRATRLPIALLLAPLALSAHAPGATAQATLPTDFVDELLVGGLDAPTNMAFLPDGRLLVVERTSARVRLVDGAAFGSTDPLGVVDSVENVDGEQGLLGVAVDPGWPARPYLYFQHSTLGQQNRITRYTALGDLDGTGDRSLALDPASRRVVLQFPDQFPRHNGGSLQFGPDGMLYASLGDDQFQCHALDLRQLRGKILRLDVSGIPPGPGPPPPNALLAPADNPFAAHPDSNARLVYAYGLRNPFSFGVDPVTGDLIIADVGTNLHEELDWAHSPGMDFGWPHWEGPERRPVTCSGTDTTTHVGPIASYPHAEGGSIITAGVYRVPPGATRPFPPSHQGSVFYADFYGYFVRRLEFVAGSWQPAPPAPGQPNPTDWAAGTVYWVPDWTVGPEGDLYYLRMWVNFLTPDGQVRRIVYTGNLDAPRSAPAGIRLVAAPSPARGAVQLSFALERDVRVALAIHDLGGRRVRQLLPGAVRAAGRAELVWDGRDEAGRRVPPGIYHAILEAGPDRFTRRVVLVR